MSAPETPATVRRRRGGVVWPTILIGIGVVALLSNLGLLTVNVWSMLASLWPIVLIAIGLDMLIGRRSTWGALLVAAITLGLMIVGLAVWQFARGPTGSALTSESFSQSLDEASKAEVELRFDIGTLRLSGGAEPGLLASGSLALAGGETVTRDFRVSGDTAYLKLEPVSGRFPLTFDFGNGRRAWDLKLNRDVPLSLKISTGVGESTLDLSDVRVTMLSVSAGVGATRLTLPSRGQIQATVSGGVGQLTITIPPAMAARIHANAGLGGVSVRGGFQQQGDVYLSPNYDTAENRVELRVSGGVGQIVIR